MAEMEQDALVRATARALAEAVVQTEITCQSNGGEDTQACGSTQAEVENIARAEVLLPSLICQCGIILDSGNPCDPPCRMQVIGSLNDVRLYVHMPRINIHSGYLKDGTASSGYHVSNEQYRILTSASTPRPCYKRGIVSVCRPSRLSRSLRPLSCVGATYHSSLNLMSLRTSLLQPPLAPMLRPASVRFLFPTHPFAGPVPFHEMQFTSDTYTALPIRSGRRRVDFLRTRL